MTAAGMATTAITLGTAPRLDTVWGLASLRVGRSTIAWQCHITGRRTAATTPIRPATEQRFFTPGVAA